MGPLLLFLVALADMLIKGGIAFFIFKHFATRRGASIAAFWMTFGWGSARYVVKNGPVESLLPTLVPFAGAVAGLLLLWWWLFRHQREADGPQV